MEYTYIHNHQSQFLEWFGGDKFVSTTLPEISENMDYKRVPITSGDRNVGQFPYYGASGIVDYIDNYIFDEPLLLVSEDGANLKDRVTPIAFIAEGKYWVNNHAHVLKFTNFANMTYICHFFNFTNIEKYLTGMAQPKLNQAQLNTIKIPWPPVKMQEQFAALVEQADKSKFDGFKSQFLEWFGNVTETTSLSSLIAESYPGEWGKEAKNNNGVKVLRTTNFQNNGHIDYSDVIVRYIEQKKIEKKCLRTGDIILERSGGTKDNPVGRVVLFEAEGEYMFNNFTQLLRPIKSVNPYYLFFYLHTSYNADKASMRAMASQTTGIQNLNMTDYMAKEIPLPSLEEQEQFERLYRQADKSKYYEINETSYGIL